MRQRGAGGKYCKEGEIELGKGEAIVGEERGVLGTLSLEAERGHRPGIERELRVIRVGPNPRMVMCEYMELASRRRCVVNVRDNRKWLKGMRFRMEEPRDEEAYVRAWVYTGVAPRRKGRW